MPRRAINRRIATSFTAWPERGPWRWTDFWRKTRLRSRRARSRKRFDEFNSGHYAQAVGVFERLARQGCVSAPVLPRHLRPRQPRGTSIKYSEADVMLLCLWARRRRRAPWWRSSSWDALCIQGPTSRRARFTTIEENRDSGFPILESRPRTTRRNAKGRLPTAKARGQKKRLRRARGLRPHTVKTKTRTTGGNRRTENCTPKLPERRPEGSPSIPNAALPTATRA